MKFYRQFDQMDCGPACIQMVASHFGKEYPLSYLRYFSHLTREEVSVSGIRNALNRALCPLSGIHLTINPNRSLDRNSTNRYRKDRVLLSFICLLASCFSFVLDVVRYAFELTVNHLLNNPIKSVQDLMTDLV
ncbi:cysteine peptidase family C39 domain-containing protein [Ihuprevotella massiliensis]|uniref:cysteine peptidase family C39 domain-containing protein n=1 Tax=Ihuprevotella massiliensis TaxID=1852368 RepID=UPI003D15D437